MERERETEVARTFGRGQEEDKRKRGSHCSSSTFICDEGVTSTVLQSFFKQTVYWPGSTSKSRPSDVSPCGGRPAMWPGHRIPSTDAFTPSRESHGYGGTWRGKRISSRPGAGAVTR